VTEVTRAECSPGRASNKPIEVKSPKKVASLMKPTAAPRGIDLPKSNPASNANAYPYGDDRLVGLPIRA